MRGGGSSWQSLARGTGAIEVDYLNGEIVWVGRCQGRDTPVNAALCELANRMARRRRRTADRRRGGGARRDQVSWRSSCSSASSSETSRAKLSSETRMPRARTSIAFSPADNPFVTSRSARFRTTSATW